MAACAPPWSRSRRLPKISERSDPVRGEGEVLIRVLAVPLNPIEINVGAGRHGGQSAPPLHPGGEAVGRVVEAETPAADTPRLGQRAGTGTRRDGGLRRAALGARGRRRAASGGRRSGAGRSTRRGGYRGMAAGCVSRACARATWCSSSVRPGRWGSWRCRARACSALVESWRLDVGPRRSSGRSGSARTRWSRSSRRISSLRSRRRAAATGRRS